MKEFTSRKKLEKFQLERVKWTVKQAKKSPFYSERLKSIKISRVSDVISLPVTTKDDLRSNSPFGLLSVSHNKLSEYHESFGTTGVPVSSWLTKSDFDNYVDQVNRCGVEFNEKDVVLVRFPYAISVPAHIVHAAARRKGACVIPASSRTFISPHTRVIKLMQKLKATIFASLPFEAILLYETARLLGHDPKKDFKTLRAICVAGELLTQSKKELIERLWNCKVYNLYGTTETGNLAATCKKGNLHISSDHFFLEVLNPKTLEPLPLGETGILVVTTLTREAMPLIRYNLGDMGRLFSSDVCSCKSIYPVLQHFGRIDEAICYGQRFLPLGVLEEEILRFSERFKSNFWIIILLKDRILVKIESENPKAKIDLKNPLFELQSEIGVAINFELVPKGGLFAREKLLQVNPVIKPKYMTDWRTDSSHPERLDRLMVGYGTFVQTKNTL